MQHTFETNKVTQCSVEGNPDWWHDYSPDNGVLMELSPESKMAISICNRCDALEECRDFSMRYSGLHGVWGGLATSTRTRLQNVNGLRTIPFHETWRAPTQPLRKNVGEDVE